MGIWTARAPWCHDPARIGFSLGSLDDPAAVVPQIAFGTESKLPWADGVPGLPASTTEGDIPAERMEQLRSLQHPDHDTDGWTLA